MDADSHKESTAYLPSRTSAMSAGDDIPGELSYCPSTSSPVHRSTTLVENSDNQNYVKPDITHRHSHIDALSQSPTEKTFKLNKPDSCSHLNDNVHNYDRHCIERDHRSCDLSKICEMQYHPSSSRLPVKESSISTPESKLGLRTNLVDSFWSPPVLGRSDLGDHSWHADCSPSKEQTRCSTGPIDYQTFQEPQSYGSHKYESMPRRSHCQVPTSQNIQRSSSEPRKEKKSISTKTFATGMMDVSLLTNTATHLRTVLANPGHDFYMLLLYLILASIALQIISSILRITADFCKTQVKEKDMLTQGRRKVLNFLALVLVMIVTSLNILISVFSTPVGTPARTSKHTSPMFSAAQYMGDQSSHSEL